jgi:hypothetical protein
VAVTFVAGPPSSARSTLTASPSSVSANGTKYTTLSATALDAQGNPVVGQTVNFSATGSSNTFDPASGTTNASGVLTARLSSTFAEVKTVTADFGTATASTSVIFVGAPSAANSSLSASPTVVINDGLSTTTLTTVVRDANNHPISGQAVTLTSTGTLNTFTPSAGTTDANGSFTATMASTHAETKTVTATFSGVTATTTVTFTACSALFLSPAQFTVGSQVLGVAAADLNGDGRADLIAADSTVANVSVWMATNSGTILKPRVTYATGTVPYVVATGDFNHDGRIDVVSANNTANTVSLLLNLPDAGLASRVDFSLASGSSPQGIVVADFNGDGYPDVATANNAANTTSVLFGDGAGGFQPALAVPLSGGNPYGITAGDWNHDGKADLALVEVNTSKIDVLLSASDGGFAGPYSYSSGVPAPKAIVNGDFNHDGVQDLATVGNTLGVLLGYTDGGFAPAVSYSKPAGGYTLATADLDGDGNLDLVVGYIASTGVVSVVLGNSDGTFREPVDYSVGSGVAPIFVTTGDFNGDGLVDIASGDYGSFETTVLLNTGTCGP